MVNTTLTVAERIDAHHRISGQAYHDELSQKIREVFNKLSPQESRNAVNTCFAGRSYIVEVPVSDIFNEEYHYDMNNLIRMSPLFSSVRRILIFKNQNDVKLARIWLKGDIRKFLPKETTK